MPFYIVGKEISLEDVRLTLQKMADRFLEHPSTVLVMTNLYYAEAPWLAAKSLSAAIQPGVARTGAERHDRARVRAADHACEPFLAENWKARRQPKTGNPVYERPVVLVIYRDDHKLPARSDHSETGRHGRADYDLVIASQPYRARASVDFKAKRVIAPLARALGPGGRLIAIHSYGHDPGMEIIQQGLAGRQSVHTDRHQISEGREARSSAPPAAISTSTPMPITRSLFRYEMHTLPSELPGRSAPPRLAAWNAAIYVAQIEDDRLGRRDQRWALSRGDARGAASAWRPVVLRRNPT